MKLMKKSEARCFGGEQAYYQHLSQRCGAMTFGVFTPPKPKKVVYVLAGLECNEQAFATKAGSQRVAAELGLVLVTPDTSPRSQRYPGDDASWDFGIGAGFYVDATKAPWSEAYQMHSYVADELPTLIEGELGFGGLSRGIMGHSMGGHGALVIAFNHVGRYASVSALAPICAPSEVPWGVKAFTNFFGSDKTAWAKYDATKLVAAGKRVPSIRIDQGMSDKFLDVQLRPELFAAACNAAGQQLTLERHVGYDHGYYFIATVVEAQLRHHA
ncbi:MAG: S-formylglutathione hydrolase [Clostridia bacterium]|nr:S-formylglutathione hydrolase [Deltaproteobacteria bacterium]